MSEEAVAQSHDDQSHYEISLTAGQAFIAFVLLLLSLAASFAFGLMIGKGQADERLVVKKEPAVVTEASALPKKGDGKIVELSVPDDDFKATDTATTAAPAPAATDTATAAPAATDTTVTAQPAVTELAEPPAATATTAPAPTPAPAVTTPAPVPVQSAPAATPAGPPVYAQLLSTGDQKTAEALATKLINGGFTSAYVERGTTDKGTLFRVRVRFPNEGEARAAEGKLKQFSSDVWIVR